MEIVNGTERVQDAAVEKSPIKKVVGAAMAGTIAEWYEFFIYGIAATPGLFQNCFSRQWEMAVS